MIGLRSAAPSPAARSGGRGWAAVDGPRLVQRLCFVALLWTVALLAVLLLAPDSMIAGRFADAGTYFLAGRAFLHGQNYYAAPDFRQWPLVAAAWAPVAAFPYPIILRLWVLLTLAGSAAGFAALHRRLKRTGACPSARWTLMVVLGPPTLIMLYLGQMSGLCFAAYAVGLGLLDRRPRLAGCCFALMAAKPHLALLAVPALLAAPWSAAVAFGAALLLWPLGSLLAAGPASLPAFLAQVYRIRDSEGGIVASSLSSLLPLHGTVHTALQLASFAALLAGLGVLLAVRLRRGRPLTAATADLATAAALCVLPYALVSELLFLTPLLLRLGVRPGRRAPLLVVAWWIIPWLAALLAPHGLGGVAALLPPLAVAGGAALAGDSGPGARRFRAVHRERAS